MTLNTQALPQSFSLSRIIGKHPVTQSQPSFSLRNNSCKKTDLLVSVPTSSKKMTSNLSFKLLAVIGSIAAAVLLVCHYKSLIIDISRSMIPASGESADPIGIQACLDNVASPSICGDTNRKTWNTLRTDYTNLVSEKQWGEAIKLGEEIIKQVMTSNEEPRKQKLRIELMNIDIVQSAQKIVEGELNEDIFQTAIATMKTIKPTRESELDRTNQMDTMYIDLAKSLITQGKIKWALKVLEEFSPTSLVGWDERLGSYELLGKHFDTHYLKQDADLGKAVALLDSLPLEEHQNTDSMAHQNTDYKFKMELKNAPKNRWRLERYLHIIEEYKKRGFDKQKNLNGALDAAKKMEVDNILSHVWRYQAYQLIKDGTSLKQRMSTKYDVADLQTQAINKHNENQEYYTKNLLWTEGLISIWKPPAGWFSIDERWSQLYFLSFKQEFENTLCYLYPQFGIEASAACINKNI